ncbi:MAG TPA: glycosyltransferase [Thermoanaerobaculia bacterium]|nr:glycosyltransferase [Thermoanaerobaculia bacterium]
MKIAAAIPTRNRAALAMAAVRSLQEQDCPIEIFVSDNSTTPSEELRAFCDGQPRVHYLRPERELNMGESWDWAVRQAMERSGATHVTLHYDRKYSKPVSWGGMAAAAASRPGMLVSYSIDSVTTEPPPLRLWQPPWTGKTFLVKTARVAALLAAGRILEPGNALPVLANCLVPREVVNDIVGRFGDLCKSTGPDSCFMSRFLATRDELLYHDRTIAVTYATHRSAGAGLFRHSGGDFPDWQKTSGGDRAWLDAAPIPGLTLGQNILFHEYELVRRATGDRLPPIDRAGYLDELGRALPWVQEPEARAQLHRILAEHGWTGDPAPLKRRPLAAKLRDRAMRFAIDHFSVRPSTISGFAFPDDATALRYALRYPRQRRDDPRHVAALEPAEIAS